MKNDNGTNPITPEYVFDFYRDYFVPAYTDLVTHIGNKPESALIELENTLAHVAQYYNPSLQNKEKEENLKKAYSHLARNTLDCYKNLWAEMHNEIKKINDDIDARALILNIPEVQFIREYQEFVNKAQLARSMEVTAIGVNPLESLNLYKETIVIGKNLISYIDEGNQNRFNKFRRFIKMRELLVGFILGVISGLFANYFWNLFLSWSK